MFSKMSEKKGLGLFQFQISAKAPNCLCLSDFFFPWWIITKQKN